LILIHGTEHGKGAIQATKLGLSSRAFAIHHHQSAKATQLAIIESFRQPISTSTILQREINF
jgi:hypothetical protein